MAHFKPILCGFLLLCGVLDASRLEAQAITKRLILKDGSYQLATKWEVNDDRVRYFSSERNEWEEIPISLIDWSATNQYEQDRTAGKMSREAVELDKELQAAREDEELKSPQVAPGLRLPSEGGVYALDTYLAQPQLLPLDQTGGEVNHHKAHNVLRGVINPVGGSKHTIELPGPTSKIQVHAVLPAIYINLDASGEEDESKTTELPWDRFRIVRTQVKGGEYAVAEMLGKQGMNSYVWDFGIHPDAPANLAVIKPDVSEIKKTANEPTDLKKRD